MDKLITMDDTTHKNLIAERDAAQTRADTLRADLNGILSKLGVDPTVGPEMRTKAILQICEESNTLGLIAEHLGLSHLDPDTVRRRIQSDAVDLKVSRERVSKVEALLAEECVRGDNARHALSVLGIVGDDLIGQAKRRVQQDTERIERSAQRIKELEAARSTAQTYASAEIKANNRAVKAEARVKEMEAEMAALKSSPVVLKVDAETSAKLKEALSNLSSAGIVVEPATDPARAALFQIGVELGLYSRDTFNDDRTPEIIAVMKRLQQHLDSAGIPKGYGHDQKGNPVPFEERVALLTEAYKDASWMRDKWQDGTQNAAAEADDAHTELTSLGAPCRAGDLALSIAARIRALPDLLRP